MAEIHVVFPKNGGVVVSQDIQAVVGGEFISWRVHSKNESVKRVRVEFTGQNAKFFPTNAGAQNVYEKNVGYANGNGYALIWGTAPLFENARTDDKYSVSGLDAKGQPVVVEDPMIITDKPVVPVTGGG